MRWTMWALKLSGDAVAEVGLGLGANLGDRAGAFIRALSRLEGVEGLRLKKLSRVYESAPWGMTDQPAFLNMAALAECDLPPQRLLEHVKGVEQALGRAPTIRWGPRLIDIDILFYGDLRQDGADLVLPHPGLFDRAFVLAPLTDMMGEAPVCGRSPRAALAALGDPGNSLSLHPHETARLVAAFPGLAPAAGAPSV